jgi:hypothetical protein
VICLYSGGLDFSGPVRDFFTKGSVAPDAVRLATPNPEIIYPKPEKLYPRPVIA